MLNFPIILGMLDYTSLPTAFSSFCYALQADPIEPVFSH